MMRSTWSMLRRWITTFITIGQPCSLMQRGDAVLQLEGLGVREEVVHLARRVLERQLHVVEPGGLQRARRARAVRPTPEVSRLRVVAEPARLGDDDFEVVAQQRLAAREAALHRAERAALAQHAQPVVGRRARRSWLREVDRVVAEHAVQRAAVGELGEQPQRRAGARRQRRGGRRRCTSSSSAARPASAARRRCSTKACTSASRPLRAEGRFEVGDDRRRRCARRRSASRSRRRCRLSLTMPSG